MSDFQLSGPEDAAAILAGVVLGTGRANITVHEDKAFKADSGWSLGKIALQGAADNPGDMAFAIESGEYEWAVIKLEAARSALVDLLSIEEPGPSAKQSVKDLHEKVQNRVDRILDAVASVSMRLGFTHPIFDSKSLEDMPFQRPASVVADTSGVLQGGLDFVARFLHPGARLKVPAVVHMEVVNQADNYMKRRRATKINTSATLFDHLLSQAGQRALLRLELRQDAEVERTPLMGDPLRNAFQMDREPEWADLNISVPLRSYCDRLIVEAARQHQTQFGAGHAVVLLTCDQGLARMALAEGLNPLYFEAASASALFGRLLIGTNFHPFGAQLYAIPLPMLLWELATAFGSARLESEDGLRWVEIAAMGHKLTWTPMHSRNDLLWMRWDGFDPPPSGSAAINPPATPTVTAPTTKRVVPKGGGRSATRVSTTWTSAPKPKAAAHYRLSPERALQMIWSLTRDGVLSERHAAEIAKVATPSAAAEYRRFLLAGGFIDQKDEEWSATEEAVAFGTAIAGTDLSGIELSLARIPALGEVFSKLRSSPIGSPTELSVPERTLTTTRTFADIVCLGTQVVDRGYFPAAARPSLSEFVEAAMKRFEQLDRGERIVAVGEWLEAMVIEDGIHPEITRRLLDEASAAKLIVRSTEGSTTDTRHDQHVIQVLRQRISGPAIEVVHLYRGDFLLPDKSSVSVRLRRPTP